MNYVEEAIGIAKAFNNFEDLPYTLSFTLETDGKLPNGVSLEEAIK
jgi:S-methylmethionine-dependent homocysteine/selenocysteine methylase